MKIAEALERWLDDGGSRVGQVAIRREAGRFRLTHHEDAGRAGLEIFHGPEAAREIAKDDDEGSYRPLKSAPNLRHGWELDLAGIGELRMALDFFYPAAAGLWLWHREGRLATVDFCRTAARQSGMYTIVKTVTNSEADALAGAFCTSDGKCMKTILWKLDADTAIATLPPEKFDPRGTPPWELPLLCAEACNLFVAAARNVVRSRSSR